MDRGDEKVHRKKSKDDHRLRDVAAGGVAGTVLTAAALKHHDSRSSVDSRRDRRKKQGKSRSRSASLAESTEEIFISMMCLLCLCAARSTNQS
jgi:Na+/glutamate symporter